jgi:hypothetical protein
MALILGGGAGRRQGEHDGNGKPSLRLAGRQTRECEMLFLWDNDGRLHHWSASSQRLERAARCLYGFATLITGGLSSPPFLPIAPAGDEQGSTSACEK